MVSSDIISLYSKIPLKEAIIIINNIINSETTNLVEIFLKSTYFNFRGMYMRKFKVFQWDTPYL